MKNTTQNKWSRQRAGQYVSPTGWSIWQYQGDLYPKWGVWGPGDDPLMDVEMFRTGTLKEAKALAESEAVLDGGV